MCSVLENFVRGLPYPLVFLWNGFPFGEHPVSPSQFPESNPPATAMDSTYKRPMNFKLQWFKTEVATPMSLPNLVTPSLHGMPHPTHWTMDIFSSLLKLLLHAVRQDFHQFGGQGVVCTTTIWPVRLWHTLILWELRSQVVKSENLRDIYSCLVQTSSSGYRHSLPQTDRTTWLLW